MANVVLSDKKNYTHPSYRRAGKHFEEKKHSLIIDTQGASNKEIRTESGTLRFENGVAMLPSDTRAKDVYDELAATKSLHPNQYSLSQNRGTVNTDETHRYHFGWSRDYEQAYERLFGKSGHDLDIEEEQDARPDEQGSPYGDSDSGTQLLYSGTRTV